MFYLTFHRFYPIERVANQDEDQSPVYYGFGIDGFVLKPVFVPLQPPPHRNGVVKTVS